MFLWVNRFALEKMSEAIELSCRGLRWEGELWLGVSPVLLLIVAIVADLRLDLTNCEKLMMRLLLGL